MAKFLVRDSTEKFTDFAPGPDYLFGLITELKEENNRLREENAALRAQLNQNSSNSSRPPSSDGPRKPPAPKSLRKKSGKKSGGQPGHAGMNLKPVEKPDIVVPHLPTGSCCGINLSSLKPQSFENRQVIDIPPVAPIVTEHQYGKVICPKCGKIHSQSIPAEHSQLVQYGSRLIALVTNLNIFHHMPIDRLTGFIKSFVGVSMSEGTVVNMIRRMSRTLEEFEEQVREKIILSILVHFDETGARIAGKLNWIHSHSTSSETLYIPHAKRGGVAMLANGIIERFKGIGVHDCLKSYFRFAFIHVLCCAHLLRELIFMRDEMKKRWAGRLIAILIALKTAREKGLTTEDKRIQILLGRWDAEVVRALQGTKKAYRRAGIRGRLYRGKVRALLERIRDYRGDFLRFVYEDGVPFDNNLSERDIRMAKLKQKVSGCFRSFRGAVDFCRIRSYLSTMVKRGNDPMEALLLAAQGRPLEA